MTPIEVFRGYDVESKMWRYGNLYQFADTTYAIQAENEADSKNEHTTIIWDSMTDWGLPNHHYQSDVDPDSVGQFTHFKNNDGQRIFAGDIVKITSELNEKAIVGVVQMLNGTWVINSGNVVNSLFSSSSKVQILGNLYENRELLLEEE